ncbi:MAG: hypothetical protein ACO1QS_10110 [Verrucomicrobiota bacterium]
MKLAKWLFCGAVSLALAGTQAQTKAGAEAEEAEDPIRPGFVPPPQVMQLKSVKLQDNGVDLGSLTTINTGKELIALHVPSGCRLKALEGGQILEVHLENASRNVITIKFQPEIIPGFEQSKVLSLLRPLLGNGVIEISDRMVMGKKSYALASKTSATGNIRHTRAQVIACESGTLTVSAVAYEENTAEVFSALQRLVSSLQVVGAEKEVKRPVVVPSS